MNSQSSRRNILGTKEITKHYKKHYKTLQKNTTKNTTKHYKKGLQKKILYGFCMDSEHSAWNPYRVCAFRAEYQGECKVLLGWDKIGWGGNDGGVVGMECSIP